MKFPVRIPFVEHLGFELLRMAGGEADIAVVLRPDLSNALGVAHGGLTMTLLDVVMAHAARSINGDTPDFAPGAVTVEMKTSFLRPGEGRLLAHGKLLHHSATLAFCEGSVRATDGSLLAHATGTFKYLRALPKSTRDAGAPQRKLAGSGSD